MSIKIQMTYDVVTQESAEYGDFADHGFAEPGGWTYSIADDDFQDRAERDGRDKALADMTPDPEEFETIDDAVDFLKDYGPFETSCDPLCRGGHRCWLTQVDVSEGEPRYSFHVVADTESAFEVISGAITMPD